MPCIHDTFQRKLVFWMLIYIVREALLQKISYEQFVYSYILIFDIT